MRDVLELRATRLRAMPLATTIDWRVPGFPKRVIFTTSRGVYTAAHASGAAAWAPDEYEALALATELGRVTTPDVARWCERKTIGHGLVVDARVAMQGAEALVPYEERYGEVRVGRGQRESVLLGKTVREGVQQTTTLTFGELAQRLELELVSVEVHPKVVKGAAAPPPASTWREI